MCTPSRQSFFTGRYPRTIGVTQLKTALRRERSPWPRSWRDADYATAAIGKMHFTAISRTAAGFGLICQSIASI